MGTLAKCDVSYRRETCFALWEEIEPLLVKHWEEIAHYKDIPLDPDREGYQGLEAGDRLRCYTARDPQTGALIGYSVYVLAHNMHYRGSYQASQDILFLLPEYRKSRIGINLIAYADECLRAEGVQVVTQHVKVAHNFGPVLVRLGYEEVDRIFAKRLDR
jgi:GNAT superfamily N-acetyltransferase